MSKPQEAVEPPVFFEKFFKFIEKSLYFFNRL